MLDTAKKLRQYLLKMDIRPIHIEQEDDGSLSVYLPSRHSLTKAFSHFADLNLKVIAHHIPTNYGNTKLKYHLMIFPLDPNLVAVKVVTYLN